MKKIQILLMSALLITSVIVITQCKKSDVVVVPVDPFKVKLGTSTTLGKYLTDKDENALYFFAHDAAGVNTCTGGCTANWPIFKASGLTMANIPSGLAIADFDSIDSPSGKQLTYKGWPLYYYAPGGVRENPKETTGDKVGGVWFVAKPDYTIMLATAQLHASDLKNYIVSLTNVYSEGTGMTTYFTDSIGRTLYAFFRDSANINKYTKADFSNNPAWPIYETDKIVVPSTLNKTLFSSINVFGKKQLTYKGWPMYYVKGDVDAAGKFRGYNTGVYGPLPTKWPIFFYNPENKNPAEDMYPAAPMK